jgi:hypothetical protein
MSSVTVGHCVYSPRVPRNLATPLTIATAVKEMRKHCSTVSDCDYKPVSINLLKPSGNFTYRQV